MRKTIPTCPTWSLLGHVITIVYYFVNTLASLSLLAMSMILLLLHIILLQYVTIKCAFKGVIVVAVCLKCLIPDNMSRIKLYIILSFHRYTVCALSRLLYLLKRTVLSQCNREKWLWCSKHIWFILSFTHA